MNITQDPRSFSFPQRTLIGTTKSSKLYRLDNSVSMLTLWFLWSLFMKYSLKMIWEKKENDKANVVLGNLGEGYSGILCTILAILLWIWKIMFIKILKTHKSGTSLVVQRLRLWASKAGDAGLIPCWGTKTLHAAWCSQKTKWFCKTCIGVFKIRGPYHSSLYLQGLT